MPGTLRVDIGLVGASVDVSHGVDPDDFEPGVPDAEQPRTHVLGLALQDLTVRASYALAPRWAVEAALPLRRVRIEAAFADGDGRLLDGFRSIHHRDEVIDGLGDIEVAARWRALSRAGVTVDLLGGLALPSGNTEPDPFALGRAGQAHQHLFFGTGTVDPELGADASFPLARLAGSAWLRTRQPLGANSHGHRAGSRSGVGAALISPRLGRGWWLRGQLELYHEEPSTWRTTRAENSGRTDLTAGVGAARALGPAWTAHALLRRPWNLAASGGQLEPSMVISLGVSYTLHRHDDEHGDDEHD